MSYALVEMDNASLATLMKGATAPFMRYVVHPSTQAGSIGVAKAFIQRLAGLDSAVWS